MKTDKRIYSSIVAEIPIAPNSIINMIAEIIRIYCSLASFQLNEDIFNENIGISDTRRSDEAIAITGRIMICASLVMAVISCVNGTTPLIMLQEPVADDTATMSADQKMACAGTGRPKKEVVWRVSILNFAKRSAEKMGITNADSSRSLHIHDSFHDKLYSSWSIKLKSIIPGATPKLTISARESSSFPMGEYAFNMRAAKPSVKSNTAAMKMAIIALL